MAMASKKTFLHNNLGQLIQALKTSLTNTVIGDCPPALESGILAIKNLASNIERDNLQGFIETMLSSLGNIQSLSENHRSNYKDCVFFVVNVSYCTCSGFNFFRLACGESPMKCQTKETF